MKLAPVDYLILAIYFVFVLGIGWTLRTSVGSSGDFLTSGRSVPVWIMGTPRPTPPFRRVQPELVAMPSAGQGNLFAD